MHSKNKPCEICGEPIPAEFTHEFSGNLKTFPAPNMCDGCESTYRLERERIEKMEKNAAAWRNIAPPIYQQSDSNRFPQKLQEALADFDPSSCEGFGIRGPSGRCKTRFAYELLKIAHFSGFRVCPTNSVEIAEFASSQWDQRPDIKFNSSILSATRTLGDKSREKLSEFLKTDWLLIDDIGKEKPTERFEIAFYNILEHRTSNCKPIIWTGNMNASQFLKHYSEDRSSPIVRRLAEFAKIIILE
jgi:DNA replication protein DnaC